MSSSTQSLPNPPAKSSSSVPASSIPQQQLPVGPAVSNDPQRRGGGGGGSSLGAGRGPSSTPRNSQSSRRGHRNHRRPANQPPNDPYENQIAMTSSTSRRGTSITHLINWDVAAPRPQAQDFRTRNHRRAPAWGLGSGYHAVDKARYVNSNYRFVVNPVGDYRPQAVDSDVHVPWDHVLQILASAQTQCPNCPICLSRPVAPRMAKCGHIFCLPCLARYMATADGDKPPDKKPRYKKCVICTDNVYMNDIRPVRFFTGQENEPPKDGHDVVLRLVMRKQGSTLALPKDGADPPVELNEIPWYFAAEVMDYARIMKGTEDYMTEQFNREIEELQAMQAEDAVMFDDDGNWYRKAMGIVRAHMEGLQGIGNAPDPQLNPSKPKNEKERPPIIFTPDDSAPAMYHVQHEAKSGHSSQSLIQPVNLDSGNQDLTATPDIQSIPLSTPLASTHPTLAAAPDDSSYYFYQALPHYYLAPLDIRVLKSAFGTFSSFPSTILPRVENVTTGHTVDDDLRKRARYLAHLPYGCEVGFLECDWAGIVPEDILTRFQPDLQRRRKLKRDKETKEERDRVRAEKMEHEERWSSSHTSSTEQFGTAEFVALASNGREEEEEELSYPGGTPPAPGSSSNAAHRTVWGTPAIDANLQPVEAGESGWRTDWEAGFLEEDMLAQIALQNNMGEAAGEQGGGVPSHGKGQKKKKFKKVTLMTNGGKRGA